MRQRTVRCWIVMLLGTLALASLARAAEDATAQIDKLIGQMTLEEKIALLHGNTYFSVAGVKRLGVPEMWLSDGPRGVREEIKPTSFAPAGWTNDFSTAMPCGSALAATWNPEMARRFGDVLGAEARDRRKDVLLGPSLNIQRVPLCGRNFEYLSEDPLLAARIAVADIQALQANDVAACAKHFACNSQELNRFQVDEKIGERALREIYLPAFEAAVKEGGVLTAMAAYNRVNGAPCSQSKQLIGILKKDWGFQGVLMTDWNVQGLDTVTAAMNGLDLEMGTDKPFDKYYLARPLLEAVKAGKVPESVIDDKVRRHLRLLFAEHAMGGGRKPGSRNTPEHRAAARAVAAESVVLLKNEQKALPLKRKGLKKIVVIGVNATAKHDHSGGSSELKADYEITPLDGLKAALGKGVEIACYPGYATGEYSKADPERLRAEAVQAARGAEVVLYIGGLNHDYDKEGDDRPDMKLPYGQDQLLAELLAANPKTVVVLVGGSPVEMPWLDRVATLVWMYYGGMEGGRALASVLTGEVSPSGHLPTTFPKRLADSPAFAQPGGYRKQDVEYNEGIFVGYRWFDAKKIEPLFPFGYGLSYTTFDYGSLKAARAGEGARVTLEVKNTGKRAGAAVVQVYVRPPKGAVERPVRELKGFAKVALKPGETKQVKVELPRRAFAYWDEAVHDWKVEGGDYVIEAGASSRDIRQQQALTM